MNDDCLKLTAYFGERDRANGGYLADALTEIYARHELQTSLIMRGIEGFGVKHHLRTDRLLTLSEDLRELPGSGPSGLRIWEKLMVYAGEQSRHRGHPLHHQLIRRLREAGAAGATSLRGIWGYHGRHAPHGDSFWHLQRRVPVLTVIVDTPERIRLWFDIVDEITDETGVVTRELVPAFRARSPGLEHGGLELARLHPEAPDSSLAENSLPREGEATVPRAVLPVHPPRRKL